jgi:flagellar basal-body rod protein FlgG
MLPGLYSAASGLSAQQEQLDAISNDLANVSTPGYRSERVAFSDLLYSTSNIAGEESTVGAGSQAHVIGASQTQGSINETGNPLDLAIEGEGYFEVTRPDGTVSLTRDGAFTTDASGSIVASDGSRLTPPIKLPKGVQVSDLRIGQDGTVMAGTHKLGQIKLFNVIAPERLLSDGAGGFTTTTESGTPQELTKPRILQGSLEQSNVDLGREMALMISTQRDFQMSSNAIQTENQMLTIANQLRPA